MQTVHPNARVTGLYYVCDPQFVYKALPSPSLFIFGRCILQQEIQKILFSQNQVHTSSDTAARTHTPQCGDHPRLNMYQNYQMIIWEIGSDMWHTVAAFTDSLLLSNTMLYNLLNTCLLLVSNTSVTLAFCLRQSV